MHRPFPDGGIIKRYSLLGHYEAATDEWGWRILFQLETPPQRILHSLTNRVIAIDTGWRAVRPGDTAADGIRLMMIYDGHQFVEIVLPLDLTSRQERRRWYARDGRLDANERAAKPPIDIREAWKIQAHRDKWIEECKEALGGLNTVGWPDAALKKLRGLTKMRRGGLISLREILTKAEIACEPIETWLEKDIPAWLEGAQRNRRLANLSQFRTWFREAMEKRGREIIDDEVGYSSQICYACNGPIEPSADLIVKCANCGATFDQDKNTARYYWNRYDPETRAVAAPLEAVKRSLLIKVWRVVNP